MESFSIEGEPVLRPAPKDNGSVLTAACFPLVPIVNRIPSGHFIFDGRAIRLTPNEEGHPNFLHGHGWQAPWHTVEKTSAMARLRYDHEAAEWPWTYRAEQQITVTNDGCHFELSVQNQDRRVMPAGLGLHPYFSKTARTHLSFDADGYWATDEKLRPLKAVDGLFRKHWGKGDDLIDPKTIDTSFFGFKGQATITEPGKPTIHLTASSMCRNVHLYCPAGEDFFCVEPVTDRADPFSEDPLRIKQLMPGETHTIWMEISVAR